tara:strand:- start:332 stop:577 length:246 start_codon:yes stop_codon:yes gene_type:complete
MGAVLEILATPNTGTDANSTNYSKNNYLECNKDSECYVASSTPAFPAATTTDEKAKRCCMKYYFDVFPSTENKAEYDVAAN